MMEKPVVSRIYKRDGRIVEFESAKIAQAIYKATLAVGKGDQKLAEKLANEVVGIIEKKFKGKIPGVEDVQDAVEEVLIKNAYADAARAYIRYRQMRTEMREAKTFFGVVDDLKLGVNAIQVLRKRYLLKNEKGEVVETPSQMFRRVARAVATVDSQYDKKADIKKIEDEFYQLMTNLEFLPNSPTIMNAGTDMGQLSACFTLPVEDSLKSIFEGVREMALIHQSGGGTGFSFSHLRPKGDVVRTTKGIASGPVSFMRIFDTATEVVKQGGRRRGANMGILRVDHPDILEFITVKSREGTLTNFNLSVAVTDDFMKKVERDQEYDLINPRTGESVKKMRAKEVFDLIVTEAWRTGDPGLIFIDEINRHNPTPQGGKIESTNPCLTGDALIYTDSGLVSAKELSTQQHQLWITVDSRMSPSTPALTASSVFKTGKRKVYKLITRQGYSLRLTAEHKVMTERGWVEAKELKHGDRIHIFNRKGVFGSKGTIETGRILGWLVGDGTIKRDRAVLSFFGEEKQKLAPRFAEMVNREVEGMQKLARKYNVGVVEVEERNEARVSSKRLLGVAQEYGLLANKHTISDGLLTASEDFQRGFLQALFTADGSVQGTVKKGVSVRLAQNSLEVLEKVQQMSLNFGIASRIYKNRRREMLRKMPDGKGGLQEYLCKAQHELVIAKDNLLRFRNEVGFLDKDKNAKLDKYLTSFNRGPYREYFTTVFEELKEDGEEEVFDLREPLTHSFVANGIVVHNCGEQPLLPYESCNLGSINLSRMVAQGKINWEKLRGVVRSTVHFLDNVIDANRFPFPQIEELTRANRKVGLGVMGFADMLIALNIPYDSDEALAWAEKVMKFINTEARKKSVELAENRGSFPNFKGSLWEKKGWSAMRNASLTTIAPTGSISIIAGTTSGIEPLFAVAFVRDVMEGTKLLEVNPLFEKMAREQGFYSKELMMEIAKQGTIQDVKDIPKDVRRVFVTALDISPEWHVRIQAAFQKHTDNAVSKTINLPAEATPEDVRKVFLVAHKLKCKGVTVYRYGSKKEQVLYLGPILVKQLAEEEHVSAKSEYAGGCPATECPF